MYSHPLAKEVNNPTLRAIMKYRNHPSVLTILDKYRNNSIFTFSHVTKEEASFICKIFNNMVNSSTFPAARKLAHITPTFKKGSKNSKENYRLISILPNLSKIYERCMYKRISDYLENFFSKFQCGFRQGISA